jgi:hypothetical protein
MKYRVIEFCGCGILRLHLFDHRSNQLVHWVNMYQNIIVTNILNKL